jgi:hypothetical protein
MVLFILFQLIHIGLEDLKKKKLLAALCQQLAACNQSQPAV